MSSVGFGLLRSILTGNGSLSVLTENGINESYFQGTEKQAYTFILNYFEDYGRLPLLDTVSIEVDKENCFDNLPSELMDFWIGKVKERKRYNISNAGIASVREKLEANNVEEAVNDFGSIYSSLKDTYTEFRAVDLKQAERDVVDHHNRVQAMRTLPGVPFGFPYLDAISGGAQPGDSSVIVGLTGAGKSHTKGTEIIMYSGEIKKVEDIIAGDLLMGPDSKPRLVRSVRIGQGKLYKIVPIKGDSWGCNGPHVLSLKCTANHNKKGKRMVGSRYQKDAITNISVEDYLKETNSFKHKMKLWRTDVQFPNRNVLIDPYIVGVYIGDGHKDQPIISVCGDDLVIANYIVEWAKTVGMSATPSPASQGANCVRISLQDGGSNLSWFFSFIHTSVYTGEEKRIPKEYIINSRSVRLSTLSGILDSDGSYDPKGYYEITTKYPNLAKDIAFLARSLGLAAYIKPKTGKIKSIDFEGSYYRITICGELSVIPCKVPRKKARVRIQKKDVLKTGFHIEEDGFGDYYGLDIDGDHLYLLGDFTVTHNTTLALRIGLSAWYSGNNVLCLCTEMPVIQVARRLLAMEGSFNSTNLKLGRMSGFGIQRALQIIDSPLQVDGELSDNWFKLLPGGVYSNLEDILLVAKELRPRLLLLDGASLIRVRSRKIDRWDRMIHVMETIKNFAMEEENLSTISTYHYNKQQPGTAEGIYGGLAMSQLSSIVISFEYERKEDRVNTNPIQYRLLKLLKGRDGESGTIRVLYNMLRSSIAQDRVLQGYVSAQDEETPDPVRIVDNEVDAAI